MRILLAIICLLPLSVVWSASINLKLNGISGPLAKNVRLYFERWESLPAEQSDKLEQRIDLALQKSLRPLGYYQATFTYGLEPNKLILDVRPGPPTRWHNIESRAATSELLPELLTKILSQHPMVQGEVIDHGVYDSYKSSILSQFHQQGYLDASWQTSQLRIDIKRSLADVVLVVDPGTRYKITDINVIGSDLRPRTMEQLMSLDIGSWYDSNTIAEVYDSLLSSGYFDAINIETLTPTPGEAVLQLNVTQRARDHFNVGVGYGTDTGPRAKFGWTRPKVNPRGDSIQANTQMSHVRKEVIGEYRIPWPHPLSRFLSLDLGFRQETTTDRRTDLVSTGMAYSRVVAKRWQYQYGINLEHEQYQQGDNTEEELTYLLPNFSGIKHFRQQQPSERWYQGKLWLDQALGIGIFGQNTEFFSLTLGGKISFDLSARHRLETRAIVGGIATDDIETVPLSKRFYTGGDQTIRGFAFNSLAPEDEDNDLVGGQFLNVLGMEYQYRFLQNWRAAVFLDHGRAYIEQDAPFHSGAGFGFRWQLPVGVLAFDAARPVDIDADDGQQWRLHIYLSSLL